jgi:hypothetical protein
MLICCMDHPNVVFTYRKDILPHMPAYTKIASEQGESVLAQLEHVSFDRQSPQWKFEHALDWARANLQKSNQQVNLAILKRFIALHIDKSPTNELEYIKDSILSNADDLRWVVVAEVGSAVSDERITDRWNQFIEELILYAPILELSNDK